MSNEKGWTNSYSTNTLVATINNATILGAVPMVKKATGEPYLNVRFVDTEGNENKIPDWDMTRQTLYVPYTHGTLTVNVKYGFECEAKLWIVGYSPNNNTN